jgi:hypothetical protein
LMLEALDDLHPDEVYVNRALRRGTRFGEN